MFQLQAEHRYAAGLIDLLFKGCLICLTSTYKNPLLHKCLYNLCTPISEDLAQET